MLKKLSVLTVIFLLVSSCQQEEKKPLTANGIWESIGSGWILQISDSLDYAFYDVTSISCLPSRKGSFNELEKYLTLQNDTLALKKGVITYTFTKTTTMPALCKASTNVNSNDPQYNFEVFATTIKEHYAFLELNKLQWNEIYEQQKNKISATTTEVELYQIIEETLEKLNDNHGFIEATDAVYDALENQEEEITETEEELPEYGDFQIAQMVASHHLEEEMTTDSPLIQWGKLTDTIGFIQLKAMWLFADLDIPKERIEKLGYVDAYVTTFHEILEGDYIEKEVAGVSKIMDRVMNDLSNMDAIVIDVRFNGGGQDAVSFEILSRFIQEEKLKVATQKLKHITDFSPILSLYIKGKENAFTKPMYVLTSQQTGSAAEAFSIATMSMKNVKRIGAKTSGAMSTALEKKLPNGWSFAISNEVYMDLDGKCYENIGVPVDYRIDYPKERQVFFRSIANDLEKDKANILKAINTLQ